MDSLESALFKVNAIRSRNIICIRMIPSNESFAWEEDLLDGDREGYVEDDDEVCDGLEQKDLNEIFEIFAKYHNSIVGHFGIGNTLKGMSLGGNNGRACEKMLPNGSKNARFVRKSSGEKVQSGRTK